MLSPFRPSVCLSSVTLVRPTQPVEIFGNFSSAFNWYLGHPLTSTENFYGDRPREPLRRGGGVKRKRVANYSDFSPLDCCISETVQDRR